MEKSPKQGRQTKCARGMSEKLNKGETRDRTSKEEKLKYSGGTSHQLHTYFFYRRTGKMYAR